MEWGKQDLRAGDASVSGGKLGFSACFLCRDFLAESVAGLS
jgi:hypothetical protein